MAHCNEMPRRDQFSARTACRSEPAGEDRCHRLVTEFVTSRGKIVARDARRIARGAKKETQRRPIHGGSMSARRSWRSVCRRARRQFPVVGRCRAVAGCIRRSRACAIDVVQVTEPPRRDRIFDIEAAARIPSDCRGKVVARIPPHPIDCACIAARAVSVGTMTSSSNAARSQRVHAAIVIVTIAPPLRDFVPLTLLIREPCRNRRGDREAPVCAQQRVRVKRGPAQSSLENEAEACSNHESKALTRWSVDAQKLTGNGASCRNDFVPLALLRSGQPGRRRLRATTMIPACAEDFWCSRMKSRRLIVKIPRDCCIAKRPDFFIAQQHVPHGERALCSLASVVAKSISRSL